jgi:hypothetical protein
MCTALPAGQGAAANTLQSVTKLLYNTYTRLPDFVMLLLCCVQVRAQLLGIMERQRLPLTLSTWLQHCFLTFSCGCFATHRCARSCWTS